MITPEEMKELLEKEFGIKSSAELDDALKRIGGIKIGIFTDKTEQEKKQTKALA